MSKPSKSERLGTIALCVIIAALVGVAVWIGRGSHVESATPVVVVEDSVAHPDTATTAAKKHKTNSKKQQRDSTGRIRRGKRPTKPRPSAPPVGRERHHLDEPI